MARTFTLEEANALVPRLARALARTTQMLGRLRTVVRALAAAGFTPASPDQLPDPAQLGDRSDLLEELGVARLLQSAIMDEVRALEALGIVVRDAELLEEIGAIAQLRRIRELVGARRREPRGGQRAHHRA